MATSCETSGDGVALRLNMIGSETVRAGRIWTFEGGDRLGVLAESLQEAEEFN